jgi:hypothetical protein
MQSDDDVNLRLNAQRALLGYVTPPLRAASVDIDPARRRVLIRFVFDGEPGEDAREAASTAGGELIADYPDGWVIHEEVVIVPAPAPMDHLRFVVYRRHETNRL